jgi:hypothetical protein
MTTTYQVAVWWPNDASYGMPKLATSLVHAKVLAEETAALGYGGNTPRENEIHIIKTTRTRTVWKPNR